ncbi:hypothetical protein KI387_029395, partial [Taxus chinensis]
PGLDMKNFEPKSYPFRVKLPELDFESGRFEVLRVIAHAIGDLLIIDPMTLARSRMVATR